MMYLTKNRGAMTQADVALLYAEALARLYEKHLDEELEGSTVLTQQIVFLNVKTFSFLPAAMIDEMSRKRAEELLREYFKAIDLISTLTPRQFMQVFPVAKDYDGEKYETKDYFFAMEQIGKIGMDNVIGEERIDLFLMEYWNKSITHFLVNGTVIMDRIRSFDGLPSMMAQFMADQGISGHAYYEEEGVMVDGDGKVMKVQKPKRRVPKYIRVLKGGKH